MSKRQSTGKRTRFEVFKRDCFTCQYCGAQPPNAVLVCDHITPVALGGGNQLENLITACEPCNQGKSDKPLGEIHPRPDADLMYLETQQEIAELQRFQRAETAKRTAIDGAIAVIQAAYAAACIEEDGWVPNAQVLNNMLARYEPEVVRDAVVALAKKMESDVDNDFHWAAYVWGAARKIDAKSKEKEAEERCWDASSIEWLVDATTHVADESWHPYSMHAFWCLIDAKYQPLLAGIAQTCSDPYIFARKLLDTFDVWAEFYRLAVSGGGGKLGQWVRDYIAWQRAIEAECDAHARTMEMQARLEDANS